MELSREAIDALEGARAMIKDLANGWPIRELHKSPEEMIAQIDALIGPDEDDLKGED